MAYVSTIVSGAACLGVLLGLISGIFFLVLAAVKWMSRVRSSLTEEELARQKKFFVSSSCLLDSPPSPEARGSAGAPNGTIRAQTDRSSRSGSERPSSWDEHQPDQNDQKKQEPASDTVKVRELMEKMVETMIGGPLDGTTVGQLSTHSAYLDMFTKYHNLLCRELARLGFALHLSLANKNEEPADLRDSSLKRLIKQIVDEAMDLPTIKDAGRSPKASRDAATDDVESKSYEDILATAILNKVIENFQSKNRNDGEPFLRTPKPRVRQRKLRRSDAIDSPRSDGDWSDTSRSDQLSLTIEEYIEEVTTTLEVSDDERSDPSDCDTGAVRRIPFPESGRTVVDATDDENSDVGDHSTATELLTSNTSWEENWLFQKKRLRSTPNAHHPVPVPMLVPNPSEDFRALVGGVDADDLSDMSDCSDFALEELTAPAARPEEAVEEDADDAGRREVKLILTHITEESFLDKLAGSPCEDLGAERGPGQTSEDAGGPPEDSGPEPKSEVEEPSPADRAIEVLTSTESEDSLMRCRVAEREKEKWMHPVSLPDNPYSAENIEKRDQHRRTNQYFRIGTYTGDSIDFPDYPTSSEDPLQRTPFNDRLTRDYYVNASKHPSGTPSLPRQLHQVSTHSYPRHPDIAPGSAEYFPPHRLCPLPSIPAHHHFSRVFRTSALLVQDPPRAPLPRRYRYGSHSLKLRPPQPLPGDPSLHQGLSHFEQKSLRGDLSHSLLRARDASPNFILNPVYDPETEEPSGLPYEVNCGGLETPRSEEEEEEWEAGGTEVTSEGDRKGNRTSRESGYGSDSLEYSSDSLEWWRLTPPKTPEVVESSLVSILEKRRTRARVGCGRRKSLSGFY